jgi:drug/metabolite transporter (DMT)-like permease
MGSLRLPRSGDSRLGLVWMVCSAACFVLMAAVAKKLLPHTPLQAVVLSRGVLMTVVFFVWARLAGAPIAGKRPRLLLLRGLLGYAALSCYFFAVQHLPLGDAVVLQYSHPLFVAAAAPVLLGERTERSQWVLIVLATAGVALIVRPAGAIRPAALVGAAGSVLSALAYIAVRDLSKTEHPLTIMVWFPLATIPLALAATLCSGTRALPHSGSEISGHLLVAAAALAGQVALTHGLARAGAARATAVTLSGPIFGMLLDRVLFGTLPTAASFLGAGVVLAALALLGRSAARRATV